MKRFVTAALMAVACVAPSPSSAQVFGQLTPAETAPVNGHLFGVYLHASESFLGLLTQLRLSFYPGVDFGFHGGLARQDWKGGNRTTLRLGTGLKVKVADQVNAMPMAFSMGGDIGLESGDDFHVLTVTPFAVASRTFQLGQSGGVTPYGRAGIAITNFDVGPLKDTDLSVPVSLGGDFRVSPTLHLAVELQLHLGDAFNDNVGLAAGVNLPF